MRLDHRQRTGLFRHLPVFFLTVGALGLFCGASGASVGSVGVSPVSATDGSEDPDVLLQMYLEWMLREMRTPVPGPRTTAAMAQAVAWSYEGQGAPKLRPLVRLEFINTLLLTEAHVAAHPDLLDAVSRDRLYFALTGMLGALVLEGQVSL